MILYSQWKLQPPTTICILPHNMGQLVSSAFWITANVSIGSVWKFGLVRFFGHQSLRPGLRPVHIFSHCATNQTEPVWTGPEQFFVVQNRSRPTTYSNVLYVILCIATYYLI